MDHRRSDRRGLGEPRRPQASRGFPRSDPALPRNRGQDCADLDERRIRCRATPVGLLLPRSQGGARRVLEHRPTAVRLAAQSVSAPNRCLSPLETPPDLPMIEVLAVGVRGGSGRAVRRSAREFAVPLGETQRLTRQIRPGGEVTSSRSRRLTTECSVQRPWQTGGSHSHSELSLGQQMGQHAPRIPADSSRSRSHENRLKVKKSGGR